MMTRALALLVLVASCTELPPINEGLCGNGILEPQEDCDNPTALCVRCALLCGDSEQCPSGFACARDGVCHAPGGAFEQVPRVMTPFPVLGFRIVDVDFDGYGDVVGLNPTTLATRYGSDNGQLPRSHAMVTPQVLGFPAITSLADPRVADVVLPTVDGLVAYTGALGVTSPRQFPLGRLEFLGDRPDPFDAVTVDDTIALVGNTSGASPTVAFSMLVLTAVGPRYDAELTNLCGKTQISATYMTWPQRMIAVYKTVDASFVVLTTPAHTCMLRIRRVPGGALREEGTSCPPSGGTVRCLYAIESLTGPALGPFVHPPVFADFDRDGCPSLIDQDAGLGLLDEYEGTTNGVGGCSIATIPTRLPNLIDEGPFAQLIGSVPLVPPVAGMRADALITSYAIHGLHVTDGPRHLYLSDRPLTRAEVGDLDRDGAMDVVLSSRFPNLDVARRVPDKEAFLLVRTATVGPVVQTVVGDFDGDQRDDLAYVEDLGLRQRLSIAYGTPSGLTPGVPAGVFSRVEFMATMQVRDSTDPFELVDDLIVIDLVGTFPNFDPEVTVLHGSPSRTMLSFYGPPVPTPNTAFRAVIAGDFVDGDASTGIPDLVALQTHLTGDTAVWVIPGLGRGRLGDPIWVEGTTELPKTPLFKTCPLGASEHDKDFCLDYAKFVAWPAVVDTDPADGVDTSHDVVLGVDHRPISPAGVVGVPHLVRFDPAAPTSIAVENHVFPAGGAIFALEVMDVDHDGMPELVAAFEESGPMRQDGFTQICRMNRDGTVIVPCTDVRDILGVGPEVECVDAVLGRVRPLCSGEADRQQLVVLCRHVRDRKPGAELFESNVYPIVAGNGAGGFTALPPLLTVATRLDHIRLGDVTGDAIDDLVALDIASGARVLHVYRQQTTREVDACSAE
jgi:hypothetical protein